MRTLLLLLLALGASACLSRQPVVPPRYFDPAGSRPAPAAVVREGEAVPLRLERVSAAPALSEPMVWRVSAVELAFDDAHLWIAAPARLVEERLESALFVSGAFQSSALARAGALHVEVRAFEGRLGEPPSARVALFARYAPAADGEVRSRLVEHEVALEAAGPEELARGVAVALDAAVEDLARWLAGS